MARVLIVDDEESIRTTLGAFAEKDGHTVSLASDAIEALDLLGKEPFDVVVSDIVLPRKSGVLLLGDIREAQLLPAQPVPPQPADLLSSSALQALSLIC